MTWPRPDLARSSAWYSCSISVFRPTNAVDPRAAAAWKRDRTVDAPNVSYASTGSVRPLTAIGPSALTSICPSTSASVAAVSNVDPGSASCSMRAARCVVWPHGCVVHAEIAANGAHDDVTGVQSDPDANGAALGSPHLLGVSPHRVLHPQRGITRAHGMVFMGDRGAEQRHDAV